MWGCVLDHSYKQDQWSGLANATNGTDSELDIVPVRFGRGENAGSDKEQREADNQWPFDVFISS